MLIAVDFDGTCVDHRFPYIGKTVPGAVETLRKLEADGHHLVMYTVRTSGPLRDAAQAWFAENGINLYSIQVDPEQVSWTDSGKCNAELFIDDKAYGCPLIEVEGFDNPCLDWSKVYEYIISKTK